jgi:uncharacterized RDD family membrane protein YckC
MFLKCFLALCYDLLLLICLWLIISLIPVIALKGNPIPPNTLWYQLLLIAVAQAFFVGFWCYGGGQTVGLKAWSLRLVVDSDDVFGKTPPISLKQGLVYFWVSIFSALSIVGWLLRRRNAPHRSWAERTSGLRLVFSPQTCYPSRDKSDL